MAALAFDGWTVTEKSQTRRLPRAGEASLKRSASTHICGRLQKPSSGSNSADRLAPSTGPGYSLTRSSSARHSVAFPPPAAQVSDSASRKGSQRDALANLAVPRRHRIVEQTLQVVRDNFDPSAGLEAAARHAAAEVAAAEAALKQQPGLCAMLSKHKNAMDELASAEVFSSAPARSRLEQQYACEALARPRERSEPVAWSALPSDSSLPVAAPSINAQRQRCVELAQPRCDGFTSFNSRHDDMAFASQREQLAVRAAAPVSDAVYEARAQLREMRRKHDEAEAARCSSVSSRPPSAPRRPSLQHAQTAAELEDLRSIVEELLWVVLLQHRAMPRASQEGPSRFSSAGASDELEDRLHNLLIESVGPALRPVARKVIGPGCRLARQVRTEFPRLAAHLGLRESDDLSAPDATWAAGEVQSRVTDLRSCRDRVLKADITSTLLARA